MGLKKDYIGVAKLQEGPGGWKCRCCNPYGCSPRKMKAKARRRVRRTSKVSITEFLQEREEVMMEQADYDLHQYLEDMEYEDMYEDWEDYDMHSFHDYFVEDEVDRFHEKLRELKQTFFDAQRDAFEGLSYEAQQHVHLYHWME